MSASAGGEVDAHPNQSSLPAQLGILGGTFNPPHQGHLALARHALRELSLDRVLLVPARRSPQKQAVEDPGAHHRLAMVELLLDGDSRLQASDLELARPGPSYTVDTLRALHVAYPTAQLTFILGADVARTLPTWRAPRELLALAGLALATRAGTQTRDVEAALAPLLGRHRLSERVRTLSMPAIDASSSLVRDRVRRGLPVDALVGSAVAGYIDAHGLYRAEVTSVRRGEAGAA